MSKKQPVAVGDYVTAEKVPQSETDVGGILRPTNQRALLTKAKILSIGSGKKIGRLELEIGDIILYNEIENNTIASEGSGSIYFIRHDFIFGKE